MVGRGGGLLGCRDADVPRVHADVLQLTGWLAGWLLLLLLTLP